MRTVLHKSKERGEAELGWLHSRHSFSFSNYYDPARMGFGLLRVLNDDSIEPGEGFGTHPHNNMEIITIVLKGALEHKDSMGTGSVIGQDEVQVMSAGTGITHSEFNHSQEKMVSLLQLWIFPKQKNIQPRYAQDKFPVAERLNQLRTVVSGRNKEGELYIHQDAAVTLGNLSAGGESSYKLLYPGNVVYLFVVKGKLTIEDNIVNPRDAIGIIDTAEFNISAQEDSDFVIIEVPE